MPTIFGAEHIDLANVQFSPELLRCIPADMVRKFQILPIFQSDTEVGIAIADPGNLNVVDTLAHSLNRVIHLCVADQGQIAGFIERLYGDEPA